jgi:hypothetical protein
MDRGAVSYKVAFIQEDGGASGAWLVEALGSETDFHLEPGVRKIMTTHGGGG